MKVIQTYLLCTYDNNTQVHFQAFSRCKQTVFQIQDFKLTSRQHLSSCTYELNNNISKAQYKILSLAVVIFRRSSNMMIKYCLKFSSLGGPRHLGPRSLPPPPLCDAIKNISNITTARDQQFVSSHLLVLLIEHLYWHTIVQRKHSISFCN